MTTIQILEKLVSFDVLGGQSNLSIINWINDYLQQFGLKTTLVPNSDNSKANIHCQIGTNTDGGVILSGHTDVVPVAGQNWETNPFELVDKGNGKLYGRGSCDMKGFVASCLALVPKLVKAELKRPIYLAFSYDEEVGCIGAPSLAKSIKETYTEKPMYAIIGEPSEMETIIAHKGQNILDIYVNGKAGHSSTIMSGVSAIHVATELIQHLQKMMMIYANTIVDNRFSSPSSTLHIGEIEGGIAPNVIADKVRFSLDVRFIPKQTYEEIIDEISDYFKSIEKKYQQVFSDFKIEMKERHPYVKGLNTDKDSSIVSFVQQLTRKNSIHTANYGTEAGIFQSEGFESIICGPGSINQAHQANEFIEKSELIACDKMLERLVEELSK